VRGKKRSLLREYCPLLSCLLGHSCGDGWRLMVIMMLILENRPHTLPPQPLIQSHTLPIHIAQNSQLNARLQTTQSQNAMLMEEIRQQKKEIEELLRLVEKGVGDVQGAGDVLGEKVGELSVGGRGAIEVLNGEQYRSLGS
jgi:hypothetical protein